MKHLGRKIRKKICVQNAYLMARISKTYPYSGIYPHRDHRAAKNRRPKHFKGKSIHKVVLEDIVEEEIIKEIKHELRTSQKT